MLASDKNHTKKQKKKKTITFIVAAIVILFLVALFFLLQKPQQTAVQTGINGFSQIPVITASANQTVLSIKVKNIGSVQMTITNVSALVNDPVLYDNFSCLYYTLSTGQTDECYIYGSFIFPLKTKVNFTGRYENGSVVSSTGNLNLTTASSPATSAETSFSESGLPTGYKWSVVYDNYSSRSQSDTIQFISPEGTYSYSVQALQNISSSCTTDYTPSPNSGSLAAGSSKSVIFTSSTTCNQSNTNTTTFMESGLQLGYIWSVTYDGLQRSSSYPTSSVSFVTPSGSFSYSVSALSNSSTGCSTTYTPSPLSGLLAAGSSQEIIFSPSSMSCTTTFTESGLPATNSWSVVYNGTTKSAKATSSITFTFESTAAYSYSVSSPSVVSGSCTTSYSASPSSGTLASGSTQVITFTSSVSCSSSGGGSSSPSSEVTKFTESGLPAYSQTASGNSTDNEYTEDLSASTIQGFDLYLCAGGAGNGPVSFNGTYNVRSSENYSFLGHQTSNTCYENTSYSDGDLAEAIVGINATAPYTFVYDSSTLDGSLHYTLNSTSDVVIMVAAGWIGLSATPSFPSGCRISIKTDGNDTYENVDVIFCPEQAPGTYSISASLSESGGLLIGAYIFEAGTLAQSGFYLNSWNVTYNGVTQSVQVPSNITFTTAPGKFSYSVQTLSDKLGSCVTIYTPNPASGRIVAGQLQETDFTSSTHCTRMTFTESGLPSGLTWSVTDNGRTLSNITPSSISFSALSMNSYNVSDVSVPNSTIPNVEDIYLNSNTSPEAIAYDPVNGYMYVIDNGIGNVSVINTYTNKIIANISVGQNSGLTGIGYDPLDSDMYVTDYNYGNVSVINTSTNEVIENIALNAPPLDGRERGLPPAYPTNVEYDPANGDMYITDSANFISVIPPNNSGMILRIELGNNLDSSGIAYDSVNGYMYVTDDNNYGNVSVIDTNTNEVIANISLGENTYPLGVAYDQANGDMYVTDGVYDGNVSVINTSTNEVIENIPFERYSYPDGIAYDQNNGYMYVTDNQIGNVSVINPSVNEIIRNNISIGQDSSPSGLVYDQSNGDIYITDSGMSWVSILSSSPVLELSTPYPISGTVSGGINVSINYRQQEANTTFTESGLPSGSAWWVDYDGINQSSHSSIDVFTTSFGYYSFAVSDVQPLIIENNVSLGQDSNPAGIAYDQNNGYMYVVDDDYYGNVSVINPATNKVIENISLGQSAPLGITYDQNNGYMYVTDSFSGNVSVIDTNTNEVIANISLGRDTSPTSIAYDQNNGYIYVTDNEVGNVSVIDTNTNEVIANISLGHDSYPDGIAYDQETGDMYVTDSSYGNVSVINPSTNGVIANISLGLYSGPLDIVYDQDTDNMYVTDSYSGDVSVISQSNEVIANISIGQDANPTDIAYDEQNGAMYIADDGYGNISVTFDFLIPKFSLGMTATETRVPIFYAHTGGGAKLGIGK